MMKIKTMRWVPLFVPVLIVGVACNSTLPNASSSTKAAAANDTNPAAPQTAELPPRAITQPSETPSGIAQPPQAAHPSETPSRIEVIGTYTFPDLPLRAFQNAVLPASITNDRKLTMGGFADLWRGANDPVNQFWMVTDRGPSKEITIRVLSEDRWTLAVPDYDPMILRVQLQGEKVEVLETIPIVTANGKPVTGLPNIEGYDEAVYDYLGQAKLAINPNGLDPDGLVRGVAGDFWVAEEYSPSLVHLDKTGKVLTRYIPQGLALAGADYVVAPVLPAVLTKRKSNRGFEGLALSENEKTLYMVVQSPLRNPDKKTGDVSRIVRIFAFDIASEKVVAEYAYRLEVSAEFDPKNHPPVTEMGVCALASVGPTTLAALECTDVLQKLYLIDLSEATNISGTKWDDVATAPSLESLEDPAKSGLKVVSKSLVLDLSQLPGAPPAIKGLAVIDSDTIAVVNHNGYDILNFALGNNIPLGQKTQVILIRMAKSSR